MVVVVFVVVVVVVFVATVVEASVDDAVDSFPIEGDDLGSDATNLCRENRRTFFDLRPTNIFAT